MSLAVVTAGQFPDDELLAFFRQTVISVFALLQLSEDICWGLKVSPDPLVSTRRPMGSHITPSYAGGAVKFRYHSSFNSTLPRREGISRSRSKPRGTGSPMNGEDRRLCDPRVSLEVGAYEGRRK
jgi:hypothetical protein